MNKGLKGALFAPLVGAVLLLGAPTASYAASSGSGHGDNPSASQGSHSDDAHSSRSGGGAKASDPKSDPKNSDAKNNDSKNNDPKNSDAKNNDPKNNDPKNDPKSANKRPDPGKTADHHDANQRNDDSSHHPDHRVGDHAHHGWDTHRHYYRYGYDGPGYYDDCSYYGPDGDAYYSTPDACDYQYGAQTSSARSNLSGDQEVGSPGAPGAVGTANIYVDGGQLCYRLAYDGMNPPSAAEIDRGGPGQVGPMALDLHTDMNGDQGCVPGDPAALRDIQMHPEAFYVNLRTADFPNGAIRGQLFRTDSY